MEGNAEAIAVWLLTRNQVITAGMTGVILGLNQLAVWKVIDEYKVRDRIDCFEKVMRVFHHILDKFQDEGA